MTHRFVPIDIRAVILRCPLRASGGFLTRFALLFGDTHSFLSRSLFDLVLRFLLSNLR